MLILTTPLMLLPIINITWNKKIIYLTILATLSPSVVYAYSIPNVLNYYIGIDKISRILIILTLWICPLIISARQKICLKSLSPKYFTILLVILTVILVWRFSSINIIIFYILFEASLIPTFLIIIKWGYQPERLTASIYLILYTITARLPLLAGLSLYIINSSYNIFLVTNWYTEFIPISTWVIINLAFLVKLPLYFFHLWLPKAHVEAPVAGSIILAAVLLKLGGYGILRMIYLIPPIPHENKIIFSAIALWGGAITSLICVRQQDIKSLIAYSSIGHIRFIVAGTTSNFRWGSFGRIAIIISHGLLRSAIFAAADITYNMSNSRRLLINKGLNITIPTISIWWFLICAANIAAPPSRNLLAEIILISISLTIDSIILLPVRIICFTAAAYSLTLYTALNHGPLNSLHQATHIIVPRNIIVILGHFTPIIIIILIPIIILIW